MPCPPLLKSGLLATACGLAGMGAAAWVFPAPNRTVTAAGTPIFRTNSGPLGKQGKAAAGGFADFLRQAGTPGQQMAAALHGASLGNAEEFRSLLDQSRQFPAHAASTLAVQTLLKRWLELDPAGAADYCRIHFSKTLPKLIGTWSLTDPAKAEAFILTLPGGEAKSESWQQLCAATASTDPDKAWDLLARSPVRSGYDGSYEVKNLVEKLTAQDLEGTIARLASLPAVLLRGAREAIAKELMGIDPTRGWEWAKEQPNPNPLISKAIEQRLGKDPAQALAWLATLPPEQRKRMQNEHGYNWGSKDASALAASLAQSGGLTPEEKQELALRFLTNSTWRDAAGAEAFFPFLKGKELDSSMDLYLKGRARRTLDAGTGIETWIAALPPGEVRTAAEASWKKQQLPEAPVDRTSPASLVSQFKAATYVQSEDPRISQLNATQLGEMLSNQAPGRSHYAGTILTGLAKTNPGVVATWLSTVPQDKTTGPQAARFAATWAQEDPVAAATWVDSLPAGELAVNAAANVARQYHRYAPVEAQTWLETLPIGPVREAAANAMKGN
jgi:hypothetical protein